MIRGRLSLALVRAGIVGDLVEFHVLFLLDDLDEMPDGADHAAHGRRIFERARAADLAETESAQRCCLRFRACGWRF